MAKNKKPLEDSENDQEVTGNDKEVAFWCRGKSGFVTLTRGLHEFTRQPIEQLIEFRNHIYRTSDPEEIRLLEEMASKTSLLSHLDEWAIAKAQEPKQVTVEFDGKKMLLPLESLKEAYIEMAEKAQTSLPNEAIKTT